uniref:Putative secreted protein n=1 Tax=Anopheles triannulatus TaxID=58253 RepID=A0A2M4B4S6_9DIPT
MTTWPVLGSTLSSRTCTLAVLSPISRANFCSIESNSVAVSTVASVVIVTSTRFISKGSGLTMMLTVSEADKPCPS